MKSTPHDCAANAIKSEIQKSSLPRVIATASLLAVASALASCASRPPPPTVDTMVIETPEGAAIVETVQVSATVAGMNFDNRQVVLLFPDGSTRAFKADKQVVNLDQIKIGDQVKATVIEELAVFLSKDKAPASLDAATAVALAPKGSRPGIVMANTVAITAAIKAVDLKSRRVTLQFADGTSRTVTVGKAVDRLKFSPATT